MSWKSTERIYTKTDVFRTEPDFINAADAIYSMIEFFENILY